MVQLLSEFLVIFLACFSLYMIYFYVKEKSKKLKKIQSIEMLYLLRVYNIDSNVMGVEYVKKHIAMINSFIVAVDMVIFFNMNSAILKLLIMFVATLFLIYISYMLLAKYYRKFLR